MSLPNHIEFFIDVAGYADSSWFSTIPQAMTAKAVSSKGARQLLSRWLIRGQALEIPANVSLRADEEWLLSGRSGVCAIAEELGRHTISSVARATVLRRDVEKLQSAFGEDGYAALLDMPALADRRMSNAWLERARSGDEVRGAVLVIGHALLSEQLAADDRQLKARLRLMFPRVWPVHAADDLPLVRNEVREWMISRGVMHDVNAEPAVDIAAAA